MISRSSKPLWRRATHARTSRSRPMLRCARGCCLTDARCHCRCRPPTTNDTTTVRYDTSGSANPRITGYPVSGPPTTGPQRTAVRHHFEAPSGAALLIANIMAAAVRTVCPPPSRSALGSRESVERHPYERRLELVLRSAWCRA